MKLSRLKLFKKTKKSKKINLKRLTQINLAVSILLAAQAVALVFLSDFNKGQIPVATNFLTQDKLESVSSGQTVYSPATHHLFDISLANMVVAFLLVSAVAHLWVSWRARKTYEADLKQGFNKARWLEYCLSGGLVVLSVAMLCGVYDYLTLLALFVLTVIASLLAMVAEVNRSGSVGVSRFCGSLALLAGILPWIVIGLYVWGSISYGSGLPVFVYWAAGSVGVLGVTTGLVTYLTFTGKKRWADYQFSEYSYILLSFVIKTALAWQIFAGLLRK